MTVNQIYQGQQAAAAYASLNAVPQACATLDSVLSQLRSLREVAAKHEDRLCRIVSRAFGDAPPTSGNGSGSTLKAAPSGAVGAIQEELTALAGELSAVNAAIDRIDGLV